MHLLSKRNTWFHILFWGALWALIPILLTGGTDDFHRYLVRSLIVFSGIALVVWLNMEVLLPKIFFHRKQLEYIIAGLLLVLLVTSLVNWDQAPWAEYFTRPGRPRSAEPRSNAWKYWRFINIAMPYFTAFIGSALFEIASYANRVAREAAIMRSEKLETEMKFLKSQINPHFLFNALNNIYSLAVLQSDQTAPNLLRLSAMLRYVLYDCNAPRVPLKKEIEYLRNFIDLSLLKDSRGLNVTVDIQDDHDDLMVAPMLFIPFVENAFKHSRIEDLQKGWIHIELKVNNHHIHFHVRNSVPESNYTKDAASGIGLENVRRRLELLYPNKHRLEVTRGEDFFDVTLELDLDA